MSLTIKKAGILDTFQDLGRNGYRQFGINPNGAMDKTAVRLLNVLLGNNENETALEMHFPAGEILFNRTTVFAIGGANFGAQLNNHPIENWQIRSASKGDVLTFKKKIFGNRVYLAIRGGFQLENWLGSSSTNLNAHIGGQQGRQLINGDIIEINSLIEKPPESFSNLKIARSIVPGYSRTPTLRITKGAEYQDLTALSGQVLLSNNFKINTNSNRMGYRLAGPELYLLDEKELISSAVNFGTIQLLPDGQMVILMADHQTTGGYPRIAHIIENDLPLLAQLGAGDRIGFHLISNENAEDITLKFERDLAFLKMGVKLS